MKLKNETNVSQKDYCHAVSLSGGKDSTAMLVMMIERDMPIDLVLFADTGMEFPEMYEHLSKVDRYLYQKRKIHITTLRHAHGFEWLMFEEPKRNLPPLSAGYVTGFRSMEMAGRGFMPGGVRVR